MGFFWTDGTHVNPLFPRNTIDGCLRVNCSGWPKIPAKGNTNRRPVCYTDNTILFRSRESSANIQFETRCGYGMIRRLCVLNDRIRDANRPNQAEAF